MWNFKSKNDFKEKWKKKKDKSKQNASKSLGWLKSKNLKWSRLFCKWRRLNKTRSKSPSIVVDRAGPEGLVLNQMFLYNNVSLVVKAVKN